MIIMPYSIRIYLGFLLSIPFRLYVLYAWKTFGIITTEFHFFRKYLKLELEEHSALEDYSWFVSQGNTLPKRSTPALFIKGVPSQEAHSWFVLHCLFNGLKLKHKRINTSNVCI